MNFPRQWIGAALVGLPLLAAAGCDSASPGRVTSAHSSGAAPSDAPSAAASPQASSEGAPQPPSVHLPRRNSSGVLEATFDDIKFEMEKTDLFQRSMLTPKINAMAGERIRISGYMFPPSRNHGLTQFVLVRDNLECCFGPGAALFDCVLVNMDSGKTASYSYGQIAVQGTFNVQEMPGPDGRPLAIYQMTGEAVE